MPDTTEPRGLCWRRLAWFVGLSLASSLATVAVAYGLRALLRI